MTLDQLATAAFGVAVASSVRAAALVALSAGVLQLVRPRRSRTSLRVWTVVLAVACALPMIEAIAPQIWTIPIVTSVKIESSLDVESRPLNVSPDALRRLPGPPVAQRPGTRFDSAPVIAQQSSSTPLAVRAAPRWILIAAVAYVSVVLVFGIQLASGWRRTRTLRNRGRSVEDEDAVRSAIARIRPSGRVPRCALFETDDVLVPISVGHARAAIMLPTSWRSWSNGALDAVLAHELSHVERGDAWRQLAALLYRAVFWASPVAWVLHRVLIDSAERASDEAALDVSRDRTRYAEVLISFFSQTALARARADWSLAMARGRDAERRIARVLAWTPGRESRPRLVMALVLTTLLVVAAGAATPIAAVTGIDIPAFHWGNAALFAAPRSAADALIGQRPPDVSAVATASVSNAPIHQVDVPRLSVVGRTSALYDHVPTWNDFATTRRVLFVFDLAHLSDEGLRNAAGRATFYAEGMATRSAVGLDAMHLWSVEALAAPATPVQFSRDASDVPRLAAALRLPPAATPSTSSSSVETLCGRFADDRASAADLDEDLRPIERIGGPQRPPEDTKMVVLFSDAVDALAAASEPWPATIRSCNNRQVSLLSLTSEGVLWPDDISALSAQGSQVLGASVVPPDAALQRDVALVFDLRETSGDALRMNVEQAILLVQTLSERTRIGVDPPHSFEVTTLGGRADVQLMFSSNVGAVRAALASLGGGPAADVTAPARNRALVDYCGSLGRTVRMVNSVPYVTLTNTLRSVVYFGPPRGLAGAQDLPFAVALSQCAQANVDVFVGPTPIYQGIQFAARSSAAPSLTVTVVERADTPVSVTLQDRITQVGYVTALVHNTSTKTVNSITLQAVLRAEDGTTASRVFSRAGPATLIAPGMTAEVASQVVDADALRGVSDRLHVEVSVAQVDFTDGTSWKSNQDPSRP